jgi:IclR family transcriptional regulator, acetate operon repressor
MSGLSEPVDDDLVRDSVIERVLTILHAFDGRQASLSLAELARRTGLPKSTLHRITTQLVENGLLCKATDARLFLSLQIFELGARVPITRLLREASLPYLQDLFETFHETVHLAILDGGEILYLERLGGQNQSMVPSRVGGRFPAHQTALGKALLAYEPGWKPSTSTPPPSGRRGVDVDLAEQFARIRRDHVAVEMEESAPGVVCVGSPFFGPGRRPVGAISVSGSTRTLPLDAVAVRVRHAADAIGRALPSDLWTMTSDWQ